MVPFLFEDDTTISNAFYDDILLPTCFFGCVRLSITAQLITNNGLLSKVYP